MEYDGKIVDLGERSYDSCKLKAGKRTIFFLTPLADFGVEVVNSSGVNPSCLEIASRLNKKTKDGHSVKNQKVNNKLFCLEGFTKFEPGIHRDSKCTRYDTSTALAVDKVIGIIDNIQGGSP